jgi:cytochrome c oxidase assembly factor CtaG
VTSGLPRPGLVGLATQWSFQPLAAIAVLALAWWYWRAARRVPRWPARRWLGFTAGLALLAWTTCGFPEAYHDALFWVWTAQALTLWLLVPLVLLAGRPLHLTQARYGADAPVLRVLRSRWCRGLANPLVGPALVPILSAVLFFGPLAGWTVQLPVVGWLLQLALVLIGALILLPLVGLDDGASSLAVGLSLAIGMVELVLDAVPGIVLRLRTHLTTGFFDHRAIYPWTPHGLHDQQIAGAILWCVAELIDLPFLLLVFRRWQRADEQEAATVDAVLDAERIARGAMDDEGTPDRDAPWWLTDPTLRDRYGR